MPLIYIKYKNDCKLLLLFKRLLNEFISESNYSYLSEHKLKIKHFIKIVPTDNIQIELNKIILFE